ncbi:MAG: hypothetical protein GY803_31700 [Chloroflexi bacterium]|nr:hypothetical protein [Chloroflexota bacterium]
MRKYALVIGWLLLAACGEEATAVSSTSPIAAVTPTYTLARLEEALYTVGLPVEIDESFTSQVLTPPMQQLRANGESIEVYIYADTATAVTEASWIAPLGDEFARPDPDNPNGQLTVHIEWIGTPHWFQGDNLIVAYAGDTQAILVALEAIFGPQIAGKKTVYPTDTVPLPTAVPATAHPASIDITPPLPTPTLDEWRSYTIPYFNLTFDYPADWFVHEAGKALQITPNAQPTWSSFFDPDQPHGGSTFDLMYNLNRQMGATPLDEVENLLHSYETEMAAIEPAAPLPDRPDIVVGVYRFTDDEEMVLLLGAVVNPIEEAAQPVIAMSSAVKLDKLVEMQTIFEAILDSLRFIEPTQSLDALDLPETQLPTAQNEVLTAVSPNGLWRVIIQSSDQVPPTADDADQFPDGKYYVQMRVEQDDGGQVWTAVDEWRDGGLGLTYPEPVRWSADGRYFYFANVPVPDGCSLFINGGDLWRLDLSGGEVVEIAPYIGLVMALSPDETHLAVNASYGRGFLIRNLATGEEQPIPLPQLGDWQQISGLQWSPDRHHLLLAQAVNPCGPDMKTAVVRINVTDLSATIVLEADERNFTLLEWVQNDETRLQSEIGEIWYLDPFSGELAFGEQP